MKALLLLMVLVVDVGATQYFIDYNAANDSANGLTTSTPWKRCPGMNGFAGSYSHAAGDTFIFKGGVTWTNTAFPLAIANSGSSGNVDTYGVDLTYYTGGSWSRPVFNIGYNYVSGSGNAGSVIFITGSYITIDGIEIKGQYIPNSTNFNAFGVAGISSQAGAVNIIAHNCFIHNWHSFCPTANLPADTDNTDDGFGGIFCTDGPFSVLQCTIGWGEPPTGRPGCSGTALTGGFSVVQSNLFEGCSQFVNSGASENSYNIYRRGTNSYDALYHANAIYHLMATGQRSYIHHNFFHDLDTTFQAMLIHAGEGGATNTACYIYDNVLWNLGTGGINLDEAGINHAGSGTRYYVWNNTVAFGNAVGVVSREQSFHVSVVDCRNNHWISDTNVSGATNPIVTDYSSPGTSFANPESLIDQNNLWHTTAQAASAGYNIANLWSPTLISSPTVDYGQSLTASNLYSTDLLGVSRPQGAAWDSGAYEFSAASAFPVMTLVGRQSLIGRQSLTAR